jgi:hypothetical protein
MLIQARKISLKLQCEEFPMSVETTGANVQAGSASFPVVPLDWTKSFAESAKLCGGLCREAAKFTSRRLQEQVDYFQELAECDDPVKIFYCNGRFFQRSFANSAQDAQAAFTALQSSYNGSKRS